MSSTRILQFPAPAKINRFLHIMGKRADGYHLLETVFQFISLSDYLDFEIIENTNCDALIKRIDADNYGLPERDLVVLAAEALAEFAINQDAQRILPQITITLTKNIPSGAGLGGGSSDAASTLLALNRLWQLNYTDETLAQIGATLGADVPIFIYGASAWATGVGDQLHSFTPDMHDIVLCLPNAHADTKHVFKHYNGSYRSISTKEIDFWQQKTQNDLTATSCNLYPKIAEAMAYLAQFGHPIMSGTGAAVFLICENAKQAEHIVSASPSELICIKDRLINATTAKQYQQAVT